MIHYLMYIDTEGDIVQIRIAKGVNPANKEIDAEVGLYCVHHMDPLEDISIFHNLKAWNYTTEAWEDRTTRPNRHAIWQGGAWTWASAKLLDDIRKERGTRLALTDWAIVADSPLSDSQKADAMTYRTALRNLPSTITIANIDSVEDTPWPAVPSFLA